MVPMQAAKPQTPVADRAALYWLLTIVNEPLDVFALQVLLTEHSATQWSSARVERVIAELLHYESVLPTAQRDGVALYIANPVHGRGANTMRIQVPNAVDAEYLNLTQVEYNHIANLVREQLGDSSFARVICTGADAVAIHAEHGTVYTDTTLTFVRTVHCSS
jgi:hypothetical protein